MAKKKLPDLEIIELYLVKADWHRTFMAQITREKTKDGKEIIEHHIIGVPDSKQSLQATDRLVIFGHVHDIDRFLEINT